MCLQKNSLLMIGLGQPINATNKILDFSPSNLCIQTYNLIVYIVSLLSTVNLGFPAVIKTNRCCYTMYIFISDYQCTPPKTCIQRRN